MGKENLIPLNKRTPAERFAIQSKGGRSTSPAKRFAARMNGMKNKKGLTDEQRIVMCLLKDKQFLDAFVEINNHLLSSVSSSDDWIDVRDSIIKIMPQKLLQLTVDSRVGDEIAENIIQSVFNREDKKK